jgi:transcriptional regulator with XRE-family HTH domain
MNTISPASRLLRTARDRAALTQRALAVRAGTAQSVVARIEAGLTSPSFETLARLLAAAGFGLSAELSAEPDRDAVIDAYRRDVDRATLRENLKKSPTQRVRGLAALSRFAAEAHRAGRAARRRP